MKRSLVTVRKLPAVAESEAPGTASAASRHDRIANDRRADRRYRIHLGVTWKVIRRRQVLESGTGYTLDFSSGGALVTTSRFLPVGSYIELSVAWPARLHNEIPIQLLAAGRIVRSERTQIAVRIDQHEFRTAAASRRPVVMHLPVTAPPANLSVATWRAAAY